MQQVSAKSYFEQLCEFNPNWKKYETHVSQKDAIHFSSEVEYIQAHLTSVLTILRSNSTHELSDDQLSSRLQLIEILDGYRQAGKFPINYHVTDRVPVFIDENNTFCAVGFLMRESGFEALAREIAAKDNYVWVKDLADPQVIEWQVNAGFTLEELKIIQGAYDYYQPNARILPNRYEVPQKPDCATAFFEDKKTRKELAHTSENVWFHGDGKNGVLNGMWIQNYAVGIPWIQGYYKNGERTGQWKEYYQGTDILCRTENWKDDKLNGLRIRFDREGNIIEEILFKDGNAVTKTNYDRAEGIKSVRTPLDSVNLYTEVYTLAGRLLATGNEQVHNPGNLLWFQNIELTALNSAAITARESNTPSQIQFLGGMNRGMSHSLFQTPPLVEYKKEGMWVYFAEVDPYLAKDYRFLTLMDLVGTDFQHAAKELTIMTNLMGELEIIHPFDSLVVHYANNAITDFIGHGQRQFNPFHFDYYNVTVQDMEPIYSTNPIMYLANPSINQYHPTIQLYQPPTNLSLEKMRPLVKQVGEYDENGYRIGVWKHFNLDQGLFKVEKYLKPMKEEVELELGQR